MTDLRDARWADGTEGDDEPATAGSPNGLRRAGSSHTTIFATMLVFAVANFAAAFKLSVDDYLIAKNPGVDLACDVNSVVSCSTVAESWQSNLLGFPNAFIGIATGAVLVTIAVAGLAGVRFPRWFMFAAQLGFTAGLAFAYWMFQQSMMVIGALCPWCLVITFSTTGVFAALTHYNVLEDMLYLPRGLQARAREFVAAGNDLYLWVAWVIVLAATVLLKYGDALIG